MTSTDVKQLVEPLQTNNDYKEVLSPRTHVKRSQGIMRRGVEIANIFRKVTWHLSKFVKCLISESLKCILLMLKRIGYLG